MKTAYWVTLIVLVWLGSFAAGFAASSATGVQPGYFEAAEAGGYGSSGDATIEGMSKDVQDYYKDLYKDAE
jgi:hypothetical protein